MFLNNSKIYQLIFNEIKKSDKKPVYVQGQIEDTRVAQHDEWHMNKNDQIEQLESQ